MIVSKLPFYLNIDEEQDTHNILILSNHNGYMLEKCNCCGFEEKRLADGKVPLVLDFIDGDRKNHKYENLRMLCFNCSFLLNGNLTGPKKEYEY